MSYYPPFVQRNKNHMAGGSISRRDDGIKLNPACSTRTLIYAFIGGIAKLGLRAHEDGSPGVRSALEIAAGIVVLLAGLYLLYLVYDWLRHKHAMRRTNRIKRALDHWRVGEIREALEILNRMPNNTIAQKLHKAIHDGKDGNTWKLILKNGKKY